MIVEWWTAHNHPILPPNLVPPIGFIASKRGEDFLAVFLYFDRNVPVCSLGHIVSAPNLTAQEVASAGEKAIEAAKEFARSYGSLMMRAYVPKFIARFAKRGGFEVDERELVNISCQLQEEPWPSSAQYFQ